MLKEKPCFVIIPPHLLSEISARLRLTTPLPSSLRSNDDVDREASNIAEMIDFVNSIYNDYGRGIARSGGYGWFPSEHPMLRRFELPAVQGINFPPSLVEPNDEDTENQLEKLVDTVRYHVIDNPEVLEEYSNKQKQKNIARLLNPVPVTSDTSAEAKAFSTVENKLRYYHSKSKSTVSHKSIDSNKFDQLHHTPDHSLLDAVQEVTTVESTYRPSFPDDDDDDDKLVTEDIEVTVTEKVINTQRADANNHGGNNVEHLEINNTVEIEKKTQDNKALDKEDQARFEEKKAHTKEIVDIKHEFPLKTDKNNDGVTVSEEKNGSNKEYIVTEVDHNSNERLSKGNLPPRDENSKNDENKQINGTTDTNSDTDNKLKERSWDTNKINNLPVERLMGSKDKSALRTQQKNNYHDYEEQHSIYSHKERNENSNKRFKKRHEKRDEYDSKKKDKNYKGRSKKEKKWSKIDKQRHEKDNGFDRMEFEWNKRHQKYAEHDNWNVNDNQRDYNSRDRDSDKRDNDWDKRVNDWKKTDNNWKNRDSDWNKRDIDSNQRDIDSNKRDDDWNKRDNDWNKRDSEWIKKEHKAYKNDRNEDDWDRKQNERENKYSDTTNDKGKAHERYEIVERKRKDGDHGKHPEV